MEFRSACAICFVYETCRRAYAKTATTVHPVAPRKSKSVSNTRALAPRKTAGAKAPAGGSQLATWQVSLSRKRSPNGSIKEQADEIQQSSDFCEQFSYLNFRRKRRGRHAVASSFIVLLPPSRLTSSPQSRPERSASQGGGVDKEADAKAPAGGSQAIPEWKHPSRPASCRSNRGAPR
jgi:hypothetical protein